MMQEYGHGGDRMGFQAAYGREPLDFSANVSPLGVPAGVLAALQRAAEMVDSYPDPHCRTLRERLSETEHIPASQILCGNGAADLIYRAVLALRPHRALVTAPAFSEYEAALQLVSCAVERHTLPAERDFRLDETLVEAIMPGIDMVFLCQPNNPTGVTVPRVLLVQVLERCRAVGAVLVLDECFCDFLKDSEKHTMTGFLAGNPNLLILKAFTKLYAMAGVRLGYALCANEILLSGMDGAGPPWSVSSLAQAAGTAALAECGYREQVRTLTAAERPHLADGLRGMGLRVIPGEANFLLFQSKVNLLEPLARHGILLRSCADFAGLDKTWYRAAVRTRTENQRLLAALGEVLQ